MFAGALAFVVKYVANGSGRAFHAFFIGTTVCIVGTCLINISESHKSLLRVKFFFLHYLLTSLQICVVVIFFWQVLQPVI